MAQHSTRPRMTATQARSFDRYSVTNAGYVEHSLRCGCRAYRDVYTYNRWRALGYQVLRGQRAIRLPVINNVEQLDPDTGQTIVKRLFHTSAVFCRHQVEANISPQTH